MGGYLPYAELRRRASACRAASWASPQQLGDMPGGSCKLTAAGLGMTFKPTCMLSGGKLTQSPPPLAKGAGAAAGAAAASAAAAGGWSFGVGIC